MLGRSSYEASEAACVLFLRRYGRAPLTKSRGDAPKLAGLLKRIEGLLPSHTKRSEDSIRLQQFSTPIGIGEAMARAAQLVPSIHVLEPSAGTGLLAVHAELRGAMLILNELAETRHGILKGPISGRCRYPASTPSRSTTSFLQDIAPTAVLMNPPFSVTPHVDGASLLAGFRHVSSALARLSPKGRLVALLSDRFDPCSPRFADSFGHLTERSRLVFHATIDGALYQRHGTTTATRLLVFDKATAENSAIPASSGNICATGLVALFRLVDEGVPPRLKAAQEALSRAMPKTSFAPKPVAKPASAPFAAVALSAESSLGEPVTYQRKNSMEEAPHAATSSTSRMRLRADHRH